jgi:cytochrome oxidase assembly protein ShyY1
VTVTGRVRASEPGELRVPGMPARQVRHIAVGQIDDLVPYRLYGGYVQLTAERPAARQPLTALPVDEQPTALNLAYTVQWWLFAGIALVGWWFLARREALEPAPERRRTHEEETQHVPG